MSGKSIPRVGGVTLLLVFERWLVCAATWVLATDGAGSWVVDGVGSSFLGVRSRLGSRRYGRFGNLRYPWWVSQRLPRAEESARLNAPYWRKTCRLSLGFSLPATPKTLPFLYLFFTTFSKKTANSLAKSQNFTIPLPVFFLQVVKFCRFT